MSNLAKKPEPEQEIPMITRCLRVEIVKPLDLSWDEAGLQLRNLRTVMHRLKNEAVLAYIDDRNRARGEKAPVSVYLRIGRALDEFRAWAEKHKDQNVRRLAAVDVGTGIQSAIEREAADAYKKWRKSHGNERIPSFGKGQPIPIRAQESRVVEDGKGLVFEAKLRTGIGPWNRFALAVTSGRHHQILRNLVEKNHGYEMGATKIDYDERSKKWFVLIAYSYPRPPSAKECDPDRVMVLHRGVHNFLVAMSDAGHWNVVARGHKLMAMKRKLGARRKSMAMITKAELGTGARGHGTDRRYESREAIGDKEARFIKTFCQQVGARVRTLAKEWGCGRIVIGDYGGIDPDAERAIRRFVPRFPLYQLKSSIANALDTISIPLNEVSEQYVSQTCPRCANRDSAQHNRRTGVFHCSECGFDRLADWVSAFLMLKSANPLQNVHADRLEAQYKIERSLRASKTESETEESGDSTPLTRGQRRSRTDEASASPDLSGSNPQEVHDPPPLIQSSAHERERRGARPPRSLKTKPASVPEKSEKRTARKPPRK